MQNITILGYIDSYEQEEDTCIRTTLYKHSDSFKYRLPCGFRCIASDCPEELTFALAGQKL